jgi:hypothetical protein
LQRQNRRIIWTKVASRTVHEWGLTFDIKPTDLSCRIKMLILFQRLSYLLGTKRFHKRVSRECAMAA